MKILMAAVFSPESTNVAQADGFRRFGCEVIEYNYREKAIQLGSEKARDVDLICEITNKRPDIVFYSKCNCIHHKVLDAASFSGAKNLLWFMDPAANIDFELQMKAMKSDYVFCGKPAICDMIKKWINNPNKVHYVNEGFDHLVNYPIDTLKIYDVTFIGSLKHSRIAYHKALGFKVFENAYGLKHSEVSSASRINLNFTEGDGGTSDRLFKLLAARSFVLTEDWPGRSQDFEDGKDLVIFKNINDLNFKISWYLEHPEQRDIIAENGYKTVQKFSRLEWAKKIFEIVT